MSAKSGDTGLLNLAIQEPGMPDPIMELGQAIQNSECAWQGYLLHPTEANGRAWEVADAALHALLQKMMIPT